MFHGVSHPGVGKPMGFLRRDLLQGDDVWKTHGIYKMDGWNLLRDLLQGMILPTESLGRWAPKLPLSPPNFGKNSET